MDTIGLKTEFLIKEKGHISFRERNGWIYNFNKPGRYTLDSVYSSVIKTKEYQKHDSTYKAEWYMHCPDKTPCGYCARFVSKDEHPHDIRPTGRFEGGVTTIEDPVFKLEWVYPTPTYDKQYYVVIWSMFDEVRDVIRTTNSFVDLDLNKYNETAILYRIVSEECVQSSQRLVKLKKA